jgi:sulfate/thiosulfate transport system substrate-binding protein
MSNQSNQSRDVGWALPTKLGMKIISQNWWKRLIALFAIGITLTWGIAACTPRNTVELTLVSYAVTKAAYQQITDNFAKKWFDEHQEHVSINQSYGGSSAQSRAVIDGLEADVVALSLGLDINKIQKAGLIDEGWEDRLPNKSVVTKSVVTLVTTPENPYGIKTWQDLTKPGVKLITANPKSSGLARWNFLALWGAITQTGGSEDQALEFTTQVYKNAVVLARDAREASDAFFKQEQGDVLLTYENEAILVGQKGEKINYISPDTNISIDNPVAMVDRNVKKHNNQIVVEAFLKYLFTPEAQTEFAKVGFRPINPQVYKLFAKQYPPIKKQFNIDNFGGWNKVQKDFFADGGVFDRIEDKIAVK